jgi:hypothetical protein
MLKIEKTKAEVANGTKLVIKGKKDTINNTKIHTKHVISKGQTVKPEKAQEAKHLFEIY